MKYELIQDEAYAILTIITEKLDSEHAPELKNQFILLSQASDHAHLVIDLGNITFADSSGLSSLLLAHRLYRDSGRALFLCNISERVHKLLEISHLLSTFNIVDTKESAVAMIDALNNTEE